MELISREDARSAGLKAYFTGKPCTQGHIALRDVSGRQCSECKREKCRRYQRERRRDDPAYKQKALDAIKAWALANPEKAREATRRWQQANREKETARVRAARQANPGAARARARAWHRANPEKQREYDRRKSEKNPEARAALIKLLATDPAYKAARTANRRARKKAGGGVVPASALRVIRDRAKGRCAGCGQCRALEFDHIQPIAKGGRHEVPNLQMLCRSCNQTKRARDPIEWAQSNGRLL